MFLWRWLRKMFHKRIHTIALLEGDGTADEVENAQLEFIKAQRKLRAQIYQNTEVARVVAQSRYIRSRNDFGKRIRTALEGPHDE